MPPGSGPARVVVVTTSPRLPAGQLSWQAWQALQAGPALAAAGSPQADAVLAAGLDLQPVPPEAALAALSGHVAGGATPVWLASGDDGVAPALRDAGLSVDAVVGSADPPGARLLDVVAVMDRLRSPGGCPWDARQTHSSLMPYLLEETYEAYAALEDGDLDALREELGDVLLQVAFHARLAQEAEVPWSIDDVAAGLVDKLVRRHPHVFAGACADDLEGSWDALKAAEKGRTSVTDGVPLSQPALSLAAKLQNRGAKVGAPLPSYDGVGGALWDLVAQCRAAGTDPEAALRTVARDYRDRLAQAERSARDEGRAPGDLTAQEWQQRWT